MIFVLAVAAKNIKNVVVNKKGVFIVVEGFKN